MVDWFKNYKNEGKYIKDNISFICTHARSTELSSKTLSIYSKFDVYPSNGLNIQKNQTSDNNFVLSFYLKLFSFL